MRFCLKLKQKTAFRNLIFQRANQNYIKPIKKLALLRLDTLLKIERFISYYNETMVDNLHL